MAMLKMKLTVHVLGVGSAANETLFYLKYEVRSHEHVHHFRWSWFKRQLGHGNDISGCLIVIF